MVFERGFLFVLLCLPLCVSCASPMVEAEGRYWYPDFALKAKIEDGSIGTTIDFDDDLGLDDEDIPLGRVKLYTGDTSWIRAEYMPISYDGDNVLTRQIIFDGKVYSFGERLLTDFDFNYYRLGWASQFISFGDGFFKIGPLLEIKGYDLDASLVSVTTSLAESADITFALPTVGLAANFCPIDMVDLYAEASGIRVGKYGYTVDAEAGVKIIPFDNVTVTGGYRFLTFDVEWDDDKADMTLDGFFLGASVRF